MELSDEQNKALKAVVDWYKSPSRQQVFRLFGASGTGKSTTIKFIVEELKVKVAYASFTGKAALVMQKKGCYGASTIHSLIYSMLGEDKDGSPIFGLNPTSVASQVDLIVIDEVSMVDDRLGSDLLSFGKPILVLGDKEQLPPVKGAGYFTSAEPDFLLTKIHRQALENPIIRISKEVREGKKLVAGDYGAVKVLRKCDYSSEEMLSLMMEADQLIVGLNKTRHLCNELYREKLGREDFKPVKGDRLVCLKNNRQKNLLNGGIWEVDRVNSLSEYGYSMMLKSLDFETPIFSSVFVHPKFFEGKDSDMDWKEKKRFDEFNYGYAITTHKSQGSEFPSVTLFDESGAFREDAKRWLYTGITRASEKLTIFL